MSQKRTYSAASIPDDAKTVLARLYQVQHAADKARRDFVGELCAAGYAVSARQLDRWVARVNSGTTAVPTAKASGAPALLSREQRDIAGGWVLAQNLVGAAVHLADYKAFCSKQFEPMISVQTVSRYLQEDGFSYRTLHSKAKGFSVDVESMRRQVWEWVQNQRAAGLFDVKHSHIASVDFTFTGHRTERRSGFASQGGSQPMSADSNTNYTNCIITCLWADGVNRTPSMLFTYNAAFRRDRNPTTRRVAQDKQFDECLKKYDLSPERICYVGEKRKETRTYVTESSDLLRQFFRHYGVAQDTVVLSDNGNSFFEQGKSVLLELGFKKHECYPAAVHQYLSPNDNRLHGAAKQSWRTSGINYKDDLDSCLCLLNRLDRDTRTHGKHWFENNMLKLREADLESMIGSLGGKFSNLHRSWLRAYWAWMGDAQRDRPPADDNLDDPMDGAY